MRALDIAATGMSAQQLRVDVISNNIANMSTTGYSPRARDFADLHYQQMVRAGAINASDGTVVPAGVQVGLGVRPAAVTVTWEQGTLGATGGQLDVAIEGRGYLEVALPNGESGYTRDGALQRTGDGLIVTNDGFEVSPGITIPDDARDITINANGEVFASFLGEVQPQLLGQLGMVRFSNDNGLEAIGSNLFLETGASGAPLAGNPGEDGLGTFRQGYVEQSSVDAVREITDLIEAQRGYELNAKVLTAADQILGATTQVR